MNSLTPPREDVEEEEGGATSALDAKIDASTGEEMEASGCPARVPSADEALLKESRHAKGAYPGALRILRA